MFIDIIILKKCYMATLGHKYFASITFFQNKFSYLTTALSKFYVQFDFLSCTMKNIGREKTESITNV